MLCTDAQAARAKATHEQLQEHEQLKALVHERVYQKRLASGWNGKEELVLHSAGVLGLSEDISSNSLVQKAVDLGLGAGSDVIASQAARRQALADAETFKTILQQVSALD